VIALNGEQSRKMFFNEKSLDFQEGYNVLMGGFPDLGDINVESDRQKKNDEFIKRILMLIHKDRLVEGASTPFVIHLYFTHHHCSAIPLLLNDVNKKMLEWGKEGTMNPFKGIYEVRKLFLFPMI
jgi:sterol 14-demethylase